MTAYSFSPPRFPLEPLAPPERHCCLAGNRGSVLGGFTTLHLTPYSDYGRPGAAILDPV